MDDEIIYSWCFNNVECFDSTPSAAITILDKDLESFSSLRSQHLLRRVAVCDLRHGSLLVGCVLDVPLAQERGIGMQSDPNLGT